MSSAEQLFYQSRVTIQLVCCKSTNPNKLQPYSLLGDGYRVSCSECCATADGITMQEAIENFKNGNFAFAPIL